MSWVSSEAVAILSFLLPGFVAVAIFHLFTSHPKPSEFERVVQALIFTILVRAAAELSIWTGRFLGKDPLLGSEFEIAVSVGIAIVLGFIAVYLSNSDMLHRFIRYIRLTQETSYPSEWYSAFLHNSDCYMLCFTYKASVVFMDGRMSGLAVPVKDTSESLKVNGW